MKHLRYLLAVLLTVSLPITRVFAITQEQLVYIVEQGDAQALNDVVSKGGIDVNARTSEDQKTILMVAIEKLIEALKAHKNDVPWVVIGSGVGASAVVAVLAKLYQAWNRRGQPVVEVHKLVSDDNIEVHIFTPDNATKIAVEKPATENQSAATTSPASSSASSEAEDRLTDAQALEFLQVAAAITPPPGASAADHVAAAAGHVSGAADQIAKAIHAPKKRWNRFWSGKKPKQPTNNGISATTTVSIGVGLGVAATAAGQAAAITVKQVRNLHNRMAVVRTLIRQQGIDISAQDAKGQTAWDRVENCLAGSNDQQCQFHMKEIKNLLVEKLVRSLRIRVLADREAESAS